MLSLSFDITIYARHCKKAIRNFVAIHLLHILVDKAQLIWKLYFCSLEKLLVFEVI